MDRRQALKCAIGAAAGMALGGLPAAESAGLAPGSTVLENAVLQLPMMRQLPVYIVEVRLTPDGHLCTSLRFVAATLECESGAIATIRPHREGALGPSTPGLVSYSRAIVDGDGNTDHVVVASVPENYIAHIGRYGQVTIVQADGCGVNVGGGPACTAFLHPIKCPNGDIQDSQREGSAD